MTAKHTNQFILPEVIDPPDTICVKVEVPNDFGHIAAFWSAIFELARWFNWERDSEHRGKEVAAVWLRQYNAAREASCMDYIVRQNPLNSCELQRSFDGGATWESWANLRLCAESTIQDVFGPGSEQPGGRSQPGEQPGGANPAPAQCFDIDATIFANSMFLIPIAIASGWTLKLSQVKGAWTRTNFPSDWVCPDGRWFVLGECGSHIEATDPSNPMPAEPGMKLIIRLADGTFDTLPLDGTGYVIPAGQPAGNYFLLPNDSILSDNQGSVSLHLLACNSGWCYHFDFALNDQSFVPYSCVGDCGNNCNYGPAGIYGSGKWTQTTYACSGQNVMYIYRDIGSAETISRVRVVGSTTVNMPDGGMGSALEARLYNGGSLVSTLRVGVNAGDFDHAFDFGGITATRIWIGLSSYPLGGVQEITDIYAYGTDTTNPFGESNC